MQTNISSQWTSKPQISEAESILRSCVHCGFCNATCPTYQLTGDELDGPRGRIYLIKQVLEGQRPGSHTRLHLDRCLTCRNCESTCPSGVTYGHLLDTGRKLVAEQNRRTLTERFKRYGLRKLLLTTTLFNSVVALAQLTRPLLPARLKQKLPARQNPLPAWPEREHQRKIILHQGCVQPALQPNIDRCAAIVLDRLGIQTLRIPHTGCCGAISHHLDAFEEARVYIKNNIDSWWPYIEGGQVEAIVSSASGCGVTIREYAHLLADDAEYSRKAASVSALCKDLSEIICNEQLPSPVSPPGKIAFHPPCTLQHGQQIQGKVEAILEAAGKQLVAFPESHLCCGSAGTYSILQASMAEQLRDRKLQHITAAQPDIIATANIGCQLHLQSGTGIPVRHWIELLI